MGRLRHSVLLLALVLLAWSCSAVLLVAGQQQPATVVDGLTTTDEAAPPASSTSMPSTVAAAAPAAAATAAAAPAPVPATPSALAAPIDRAAFRMVATCSSLTQLPRPAPAPASRSRTAPLLRPSVEALNATLEMDATPSYSSAWRGRDGNAGGWRPGRSRLNVSALAAGAPRSLSARLHPLPCLPGGAALFGPLAYSASTAYRHSSAVGTEADADAGGRPAEVLGLEVSRRRPKDADAAAAAAAPSQVSGSATFPFLVDYDAAGSVVLYADGGNGSGSGGEEDAASPSSSPSSPPSAPVPLACCSLSPPPPDFPEEWSAVIEANVRDKGYTMVVRQLYSASNKKVRLDVHSLGNDRVVVQDYKKGTATFIDGPNATHPLGSCDVIKFDELPGGADAATSFGGGGGGGGAGAGGEKTKAKDSANAAADGSAPVAAGFSSPSSSSSSKPKREDAFLPTAAALAFAPGGGAARAKFLPSASFDVRGIPVETWARRVEEKASNSSFDLLYFFPVNAWLASGEDYHRLLKAIVVNGTQNGQRVYQEFHFVDFRPYGGGGGGGANGTGIPAEAFDPCEIAPGGAGCGCEKRKKSAGGDKDGSKSKGAKAAADFAAFPAGASGGVPSPPRDFSERQQTMGFLPSQVGSYVFFLFLGLVAGLLGAFGVPALHSCCCARRRRSFGRFEEGNGGAAPTSAVTSAA